MPLNANGKVDRDALPLRETHDGDAKRPAVIATGSPEDVITSVWRRVLSLDQIGPDDNFFDLGGDSLSLVQAHAELQRALNRTIPITKLFEFPTVRALRQHLNGASEQLAVSEIQQRANRQRAAMARQRLVSK